jgi:8-oxo-dGTP pyrophosphatase MutT (NUDIX family)
VDRGGHHSGEVSFPGGRAEADDVDPEATALREAAEEVGLDTVAAGVRVLGVLPTMWIPVSDYAVTSVVARSVPMAGSQLTVTMPPLCEMLPNLRPCGPC